MTIIKVGGWGGGVNPEHTGTVGSSSYCAKSYHP